MAGEKFGQPSTAFTDSFDRQAQDYATSCTGHADESPAPADSPPRKSEGCHHLLQYRAADESNGSWGTRGKVSINAHLVH